MKLELSRRIYEKNTQISIFMKIRPVKVEFCADRQTDRHEARKFCHYTNLTTSAHTNTNITQLSNSFHVTESFLKSKQFLN